MSDLVSQIRDTLAGPSEVSSPFLAAIRQGYPGYSHVAVSYDAHDDAVLQFDTYATNNNDEWDGDGVDVDPWGADIDWNQLEDFEDFIRVTLTDAFPDWMSDVGSWGVVSIDLQSGNLRIKHWQRVVHEQDFVIETPGITVCEALAEYHL